MNVDLEEPYVDQLWGEFHGVIKSTTEWMVPFLGLFGVEEGNGLSPFTTEINTPEELSYHLKALFKPPKRYPRGIGSCNYDANYSDREAEISYMGSNDEIESPLVDTDMSPDVFLFTCRI